ncbi:hypothetical protein EFA69_05675 [Rufibacter immobilis]|uniref:Uncharacterized protein n=1 Tax=Rufibacter immobilis TaxID=1348778 RepID=A0A3M9N2G9_9BACT|nr:hypothetical protein EFA69_05675 [Rufibacter immobilis]
MAKAALRAAKVGEQTGIGKLAQGTCLGAVFLKTAPKRKGRLTQTFTGSPETLGLESTADGHRLAAEGSCE